MTTVTVTEGVTYDLTDAQEAALSALCARSNEVTYRPEDYRPAFDLPKGWVSGWVGGNDGPKRLYVGCDPEGRISS